MSQTTKHGGGAIFVWGCMTSLCMGYMCKIEGKTIKTLYLNIIQDEVMKSIVFYFYFILLVCLFCLFCFSIKFPP